MNSRNLSYHTKEDDLQSKLSSIFGLTSNEARLYITMLQDEYFTASELSERSGIHRSRIYDNLRGLEAKKLIFCADQNPLRFRLIPPQAAVTHITEKLISEHQNQLHEIAELGFLLENEIQKRTNRESLRPRVLPLQEAISELKSLLESTKRRVWVTKRTSGGVVDWFALRAELGKLLTKGIDIRFLSDKAIGFPFDLKINHDVSLSFSLIDDTVIEFLLPSIEDNEGQIFITQNPEYVEFFEKTFLRWWD